MTYLLKNQDGEEDVLEVIKEETSLSAELDEDGNPVEVAAEDEGDEGDEDA